MEKSNPLAELVEALRKGAGTVECCGTEFPFRTQAAALLAAYIEKEMDLLVNDLDILPALILTMREPPDIAKYCVQMLAAIATRDEFVRKIFEFEPTFLETLTTYIEKKGFSAYKSPSELQEAKDLRSTLSDAADRLELHPPPTEPEAADEPEVVRVQPPPPPGPLPKKPLEEHQERTFMICCFGGGGKPRQR